MSQIGRGMPRARSLEEYKEMLKEALYEIQEVKATAEFDDYMNDAVLIADSMRPELEDILKNIENNTNQYGNELSFMQNTHRMPTEIVPFKSLLSRISATQKKWPGRGINSIQTICITSVFIQKYQKEGGCLL